MDRRLELPEGAVILRDAGGNPDPLEEKIRGFRANGVTDIILMPHIDCGWVKVGAGVLYFGETSSEKLLKEYTKVFNGFKPSVDLVKAKNDPQIKENLYREMEVYSAKYFEKRTRDFVGAGVNITLLMTDARQSKANNVNGENSMLITEIGSRTSKQLVEEVTELLKSKKAEITVDIDSKRMYIVSIDAAHHAELAEKVHVNRIYLIGKDSETLGKAREVIGKVTKVPVEMVVEENRRVSRST
jgi:hypothetical protein